MVFIPYSWKQCALLLLGLSGCLILISCPTSLPLTLSLPLTRFHTETQGRTCFPDRSPRNHRSFYRLIWHAGKESRLVTKQRPEVGTSELRICGLLSFSLPSSVALSHLYLVVLLSFLVFLGRVEVNRIELSIRVRGCPGRWPLFHAQKPFVYTFNPHNRVTFILKFFRHCLRPFVIKHLCDLHICYFCSSVPSLGSKKLRFRKIES